MLREVPQSPSLLKNPRLWFAKRFGRIVQEVEVSQNSQMTFLPSGKMVLDNARQLITSAQRQSYTQSYSFDNDPVGQEFLRTFQDAAVVRPNAKFGLLVDQIIAWRNTHGTVGRRNVPASEQKQRTYETLTNLNNNDHIQVVVTNYFNLLGILRRMPFHRDHKKVATADGERAIIGSANVGEHHTKWIDAGILFEGPVAGVIEEDVARTFAHAKQWQRVYQTTDPLEYVRKNRFPKGQDLLGALIRNPQDRGRRIIVKQPNGEKLEVLTDSFYKPYQEATNAAFSMIEHAPKGATVDIFTPYPGIYTLTKRMIKAAKRQGVSVNLHIPSINNHPLYNPDHEDTPRLLKSIAKFQLSSWKKRLQRNGIHVYEHGDDETNQGMMHLKAVSITNPDGSGELLLGSMNLTKGWLSGRNREIAVRLNNEKIRRDFAEFTQSLNRKAKRIF